jgi:hypothetical protein
MDHLTGDDRLTGLNVQTEATQNAASSQSLDDQMLFQSLSVKDWVAQTQTEADRLASVERLQRSSKPSTPPKTRSFGSKLLNRITHKLSGKTALEIVEVSCFCADAEQFWGGWIGFPRQGDRISGTQLSLYGWVIGKHASVTVMQVLINENLQAEMPVQIARPDVAKAHLMSEDNCNFGYWTSLDLTTAPNEVTLEFQAVFTNGEVVPAGVIKLCKL